MKYVAVPLVRPPIIAQEVNGKGIEGSERRGHSTCSLHPLLPLTNEN